MTTTEPKVFPHGIHESIPSEIYHAAEGESNGGLREFSRSPFHYKWRKEHPKEETPAMIRGTLLHARIEGKPVGNGHTHFAKPEGMSFATKEGKAWRADHSHLPIISADDDAALTGAMEAILANPYARFLLEQPGVAEASIFAKHEPTGLTIKTRPDWHALDVEQQPWILDWKTCDDARRFYWTARDMSHDRTAAFYIDNMDRAGVPDCRYVFGVIEMTAPYGLRLIEIDPEDVQRARLEYEADLLRLAECKASGNFPGYDSSIEVMKINTFKK